MKTKINKVDLPIKASWLLIVNSCFVIFLSITFTYMSIHVLFSNSDDFMKLVSIVFLIISIPLGILQFLATFKKKFIAIYILSIYFGIVGVWPIILWVSNFIRCLRDDSSNSSIDIRFTIYCFLIVFYVIFSILLNLKWSKAIKKSKSTGLK